MPAGRAVRPRPLRHLRHRSRQGGLTAAFAALLLLALADVARAQDPAATPPADAATTATTTEAAPAAEVDAEPTAHPDPSAVPNMDSRPSDAFSAPPKRRAGGAPAAPAGPVYPITFDLQFPEEKGGGTASGSAGAIEYQHETVAILTGGFEIRYQDVTFSAEKATVDLTTKKVVAEGNVIIDQGPRRLSGDTAEFDLETKTGSLTNARAAVEPDYYFRGKTIAKTGENIYTVEDGVFTSCEDEVPDWSFKIAEGWIEVDAYAHVKHASMWAKKLPVLYVPYMLWPVRPDRTSGLLVPNLGYSNDRGAYLGLAWFQTLGPSWDTTLHFDAYSEDYYAVGSEVRYNPIEGTTGRFEAYAVDDPESEDPRWKVRWNHATEDIFNGMRAVVDYRDYSDFEFFQDFERDFDLNSARFEYSYGFLSGSWGPHALNVQMDRRETYISAGNIISQSQLPEVEYRLRSRRIGRTPLYLEMRSSANLFSVDRSESYQGEYGRLDVFPQLRLPLRPAPWLSLAITAGGRATWYGTTLSGPRNQVLDGDSLLRTLPVADVQIVGPSFSRIFEGQLGAYGRFKHIIEPRLTWGYLGDVEDEDIASIPLFDEVDPVQSANLGRVAVVNRLLGKPLDEKRGNAREVAALEISQAISFDSEQPLQRSGLETSDYGPIVTSLRLAPSERFNLQARVSYDTLDSGLESTQISGRYGQGMTNLGLTWFTRYNVARSETTSDQVRVFGGVPLFDRRVRFQAQLSYDIERSVLQQQRYFVDYNSQCYSFRLELREFQSVDRNDRDYRFSLTLKNVGTFLDLTGGDGGGSQDAGF